MTKARLVVIEKADLPSFVDGLSKKLWEEVGQAAAGSILENILTQRQGDGSPLKSNEPSTLERKRKQGRGQRSLVDRLHRFVQGSGASWKIKLQSKGRGVTVETATAELGNLVKWVKGMGYVGWDDLNDKGKRAIRGSLRKEIRRVFAEQARKNRARRRRP